MIINLEQLQTGLIRYFEQEIASKATGFKKFTSYFMMASLETKLPELISSVKNNPLVTFISNDGNIDLDKLYNYAKNAYSHSGQFVLGGIIFNESDIDKLYHILKGDS